MVAFNFLTGGISTLLVAFFLLACGFFNVVVAEEVLAFKSVYFFLFLSSCTILANSNKICCRDPIFLLRHLPLKLAIPGKLALDTFLLGHIKSRRIPVRIYMITRGYVVTYLLHG